MKLTGIAILKFNGDAEANSLGMAADVSSYGYFQRGAVKEMMAFVARTVAKRTQPGQRQSVQQVPHVVCKQFMHAALPTETDHLALLSCWCPWASGTSKP